MTDVDDTPGDPDPHEDGLPEKCDRCGKAHPQCITKPGPGDYIAWCGGCGALYTGSEWLAPQEHPPNTLDEIVAELEQLDRFIENIDEWIYKMGRRNWVYLEPKVRAANESALQIAMHLHDLGVEDGRLKRWVDKGVFAEKVDD